MNKTFMDTIYKKQKEIDEKDEKRRKFMEQKLLEKNKTQNEKKHKIEESIKKTQTKNEKALQNKLKNYEIKQKAMEELKKKQEENEKKEIEHHNQEIKLKNEKLQKILERNEELQSLLRVKPMELNSFFDDEGIKTGLKIEAWNDSIIGNKATMKGVTMNSLDIDLIIFGKLDDLGGNGFI